MPAWAIRCSMPSSASTSACQSGDAPTSPARRRTRLASAPARASTSRAARASHVAYLASAGSDSPARIRSSSQRSSSLSPSSMRATRSSRERSRSPGRVTGRGGRIVLTLAGAGVAGARAGRRLAGRAGPVGVGAPVAGVDPGRRTRRPGGVGHAAAHPHQQQREGMLAGQFAARAGTPPAGLDVIDQRLVGLGARAATATPQGTFVAAQPRPPAGDCERLGGDHRLRRRRRRRHLLDQPPLAHPGQGTERV